MFHQRARLGLLRNEVAGEVAGQAAGVGLDAGRVWVPSTAMLVVRGLGNGCRAGGASGARRAVMCSSVGAGTRPRPCAPARTTVAFTAPLIFDPANASTCSDMPRNAATAQAAPSRSKPLRATHPAPGRPPATRATRSLRPHEGGCPVHSFHASAWLGCRFPVTESAP